MWLGERSQEGRKAGTRRQGGKEARRQGGKEARRQGGKEQDPLYFNGKHQLNPERRAQGTRSKLNYRQERQAGRTQLEKETQMP
jgi:hypothetical protein